VILSLVSYRSDFVSDIQKCYSVTDTMQECDSVTGITQNSVILLLNSSTTLLNEVRDMQLC